ncbi:hypothetical protein PDPUS_2_00350 [Photobacterium damselae subsp. piscicida]|uniref:Uncharacterized protein n=1 Tax=Photobacterium damsela subsp. piscicida TaxID=38294 RepID=A0AAD1FQR6_PHODP|nr:hypothetical protein [Photobacterium damselae subsp. piscicida]BAX54936.1 hypothetical protein PDPUS_2_00350 [Photobacterium damselae subsp. piscicida]GAW46677.1 hypothetical protein PDPJ_2_00927 [Photobacterium damselae subsp. piscicida]
MHERENAKYQVHGEWKKAVSKSKGNGSITIEPLINTVILLTFILVKHKMKKPVRLFYEIPSERMNELSDKVIIDKRGTNVQALHNMNIRL